MTERSFLGRWSERKRAASDDRPEAEIPQAEVSSKAEGEDALAPAEDVISEEDLARLPPVEEAQTSGELRGYLRRGVPPALRRAALRRIWTLNPAIRDHVDPALDYAWDFNDPVRGESAAAARVARLLGSGVRQAAIGSPEMRQSGPPPRTEAARTDAAPIHPGMPPTATVSSEPANIEKVAPEAGGASDLRQGDRTERRRRHGAAVPRPVGEGGPVGT